MNRQRPLALRLYFDPTLTAVVRLVGYEGLPVEEARAQLSPLVERFGKEKVNAAIQELLEIDAAPTPPRARLKAEARRLVWQLLGPPAETG